MPILINRETGEREYLLDADAADAIRSGAYDPAPGETIAITDEYGNYKNVAADDFVDYYSDMGWQGASQEEISSKVKERLLNEEYDTLGQEIITGVEGAARGLTLGASDWVATEFLGVDPNDIKNRRQVNNRLALGTEIGGSVIPSVLTGGGSLAAKGAIQGAKAAVGLGRAGRATAAAKGALASAKAKAGSALAFTPAGMATRAGRSITALGEGAGLGGRVLAGAAGGAAEGAMFGTGQAISELALSDKPLSAERVVASLGSGALTGAGLGAAFGGALPVVEKVGGAAAKATGSALKKGGEYIPAQLKKLIPGGKKAAQEELELTLPKVVQDAEDYIEAAKRIVTEADDLHMSLKNVIPEQQDANIMMAMELAKEAHKKALKDLRKAFPGPSNVLDNELTTDAIREIIQGSDEGARKLIARIQTYDNSVTHLANAADYVEKAAQRYMANPATLKGGARALEAGSRLKASLENLGKVQAKASSGLGDLGDIAAVASAAGYDFEHLPIVSDLPFIKYILWYRTIIRGLGKYQSKNKMAALLGDSGNATGVLANKASDVASSVDDGIGKLISGGAKAYTKKAGIPTTIEILNSSHFYPQESKKHKAKTKEEAFKRRSDEIMQAASNPDVIRQAVERNLHPAAPDIVQHVVETQIRKVQFLASKLPKDPSGQHLLAKPWKPSSIELNKFAKYIRAAEDPTTVIADMVNGKLSQEAAETLRVVYPSMFADIQSQLVEQLDTLRDSLSYKERVQLSRLFGVPVDETMTPEFIAAMQAGYSPEGQEAQGSAMGGAVSASPVNAREFTPPGSTPSVADQLVTSGPGESR